MTMTELVAPDAIVPALKVISKKQALQELSARAVAFNTEHVDAVAGATSQFVLERTPVSSTLQVRVGGRAVPRSRVDGFDYDPAARAVVFYGATYRPRRGTDVVVSYRVWAGSLG